MLLRGILIEIKCFKGSKPTGESADIIRLWVMDPDVGKSWDEFCLLCYPAQDLPELGQTISWSNTTIYFGREEEYSLQRIGSTFNPGRREYSAIT